MKRVLGHWSLVILCATVLRAAPIAVRWQVDVSGTREPSPVLVPAFQGETLSLEPTCYFGRTLAPIATNATVTLYWATNAIGPWWSKPADLGAGTGTLQATWGPTNDMGAAAYLFFLAATDPSGAVYRAYGRIAMRASPGYNPAILPPPATLGDILGGLSNLVLASVATMQVTSNALSSAMQAETLRAQQAEADAIAAAAAALAGGLTAASNHADSVASAASNGAVAVSAAALASGLTAASNHAATVAGATNAAHVAAVDPHADRAYADTLLATGTAFRALSADAVVQLDTQAWVTVAAGTALLWRVTSDTNTLVVTASGYYASYHYVPAVGSAFRRVTGTLFTNACEDGVWSITNNTMYSPEPWEGTGGNPEGYYDTPFGHYTVTVVYAPAAITNTYPIALLSEIPSLAPYATAAQLTAVSNLLVIASTNAVDPVARASAASKPSYDAVTNIVSAYAAPSFPVYDYGTGSNVVFVLSNSVLYLFGQ